MMNTLEIFQALEKRAIEWGMMHNQFMINDIVESHLIGNKNPRRFLLSNINVVIGRNAQKTTLKTLSLRYVGRRLKKDGGLIDEIGTGIWLQTFTRVSDGKVFEGNYNGVNDIINDCGLSFCLAAQETAKRLFPNAYRTYKNTTDYPYIY